MGDIKVAIIGLDTSHGVEFARRIAAPDCKPELKVPGLKATMAYRFKSKFQSEEGQDKREKLIGEWGIKTTLNLNEAVKDADALLLEVNDPELHLEIFEKCAAFGKPMFLDKPPADTYTNYLKICKIAKDKNIRFFTASGMRFVPPVLNACKAVPKPLYATIYGAVGLPYPEYPFPKAAVFYGIHTFEILNRIMGRGALRIFAKQDHLGCIAHVEYPDKRRGLVELTVSGWLYGGSLRMSDTAEYFTLPIPYMVDNQVTDILREIEKFFRGGPAPVAAEDSLEVMNMIDTVKRSLESGKTEDLNK